MGVGWELVGSCMGVTGLAEKRKEQGWLNSERIPSASRIHPECIPNVFFCFANNLFGVMLKHSRKKIVFLQSKT